VKVNGERFRGSRFAVRGPIGSQTFQISSIGPIKPGRVVGLAKVDRIRP
jgi:hypothetical protein